MTESTFELGTVLAGKYRLDARLGEGGMGTVYRAEHLVLKAPVAVKVIEREVREGDVALARFMREAQSAASLRSPHVVQILDYGTDLGRPYMVMELLEGETLASRIDRLGTLTPGETYRVITHVARAVAKAHEAGIIHRDLKPDNVFLVHNEGDEVAKVLDFGVAKVEATALGDGSHTRTGSLLGTPYYMSPEQAQGNKEIDHRSDLWALGVIAFECLTGRRPFSSDGLGDLVLQICIRDIPVPSDLARVPIGFDAWFKKATERDPDVRFQSARELSEALWDALALARDPAGSAPESIWSKAPSIVARPPGEGRGSRLAEAPVPADVEGTTAGEVPAQKQQEAPTLLESGANVRGSRWDVVPHATTERDSRKLDASRAMSTEDTTPDPPFVSGRSGVWSVLIVAVLALTVGGGIVYGAREVGVDLLETLRVAVGAERASKEKRVKRAPVEAGRDDAKEASGTKKKAPSGATSKAKSGSDDGGARQATPDSATGDGEKGDDGTKPDEPAKVEEPRPGEEGDVTPTDESLDAIEREARERTGETTPAPVPADPPPRDGPKPDVPETLTPPPPPPPPAP